MFYKAPCAPCATMQVEHTDLQQPCRTTPSLVGQVFEPMKQIQVKPGGMHVNAGNTCRTGYSTEVHYQAHTASITSTSDHKAAICSDSRRRWALQITTGIPALWPLNMRKGTDEAASHLEGQSHNVTDWQQYHLQLEASAWLRAASPENSSGTLLL